MKTIGIYYDGKPFAVQLSRIKAYQYDVFKIDFEKNKKLVEILESPVFIIEKSNRLSFQDVQNTDQRELLMSFAEGIEGNHPI